MALFEGSRLFLSCDITGSTAFKQKPDPDPASPWQKVFLQFYREFPQEIYAQQTALEVTDLVFSLWKAVGDELIFTCDVTSEIDIYRATQVWAAVLTEYKAKSLDDTGLGVKGGVFLATFPGPDSESSIPRLPVDERSGQDVVILNHETVSARRAESKYLYDFFGPSIDTGFRVLSKCSERYMTLSLEVAYALGSLHCTPGPDKGKYQSRNLLMLDNLELKGVWSGNPYPLFAIDLQSGSGVNTALRKFSSAQHDVDLIHDLCEACYTSDAWPFKMYLPNSKNGHFNKRPVDPLAAYMAQARQAEEGAESVPSEPQGADQVSSDAPIS
ncbi:hypothetical protein [Janibacter sp. LM]|uniref:hypothetical protein n=1 Tax=Janibacter sp. LM TaxID=3144845 RepID=UPI0031F672E4